MQKQINIVFFGAPGAGKGTQAKKISASLGLPHIDTGNLIREAVKNQTPLGIKAKEYVESGKLVPDDLIISLIREKLLEFKSNSFKGFILDGYPRTIPQADALKEIFNDLDLNSSFVINIKADENILIERLSSRRICSNKNCGAIYNLVTKKPKESNKCDICNSELYQRKDDTKEAAMERLKEYHLKTAPLEKYYRNISSLFDVKGTNNPDEVTEEIAKLIDGIK